jgi:hypothetical protein
MTFTQIENRKQSLTATSVIFLILFLLLFFLKSTNTIEMLDLEGGGGGGDVAVNFGDSDLGSGKDYASLEPVKSAPKQVKTVQAAEKEIVVSENDDAPVIANIKKPTEKPKKIEEVKPVEKPVPKPSKSTSDALANILNGTNSGGDGNDKVAGNKGKSYGDPNATGYNGGGGSGTGSGGGNGSGQGLGTGSGYGSGNGGGNGNGSGNWKLSGRKLSSSSKKVQSCNEYGTVVVQVTVNRSGNVIATKYVRGTTNTDPCLLEPAYATARTYKWLADDDAPETQVGTITINFKVGE